MFEEDQRIIPKAEIFKDSLFSEKAKGAPVKSLIEKAVEDPRNVEAALAACSAIGATLGMIHERTERAVTDEDLANGTSDEVLLDQEKTIRHITDLNVTEL